MAKVCYSFLFSVVLGALSDRCRCQSPRQSLCRSLSLFFAEVVCSLDMDSERADDSSVQVMDGSTSRNSCRDEIQTSCWEIEDRLGLSIRPMRKRSHLEGCMNHLFQEPPLFTFQVPPCCLRREPPSPRSGPGSATPSPARRLGRRRSSSNSRSSSGCSPSTTLPAAAPPLRPIS